MLIQSTGGTVAEGVAMYNFLKSAPADISIYNAGSLHSMAAIVFLSAKRRIASQTSTFMLHRVSSAPKPMPVPIMENALAALKIDDDRVDAILKSRLNISEEQWAHFRNNELWFNAPDALKSGIATEIGDFSPPRGSHILSFNL